MPPRSYIVALQVKSRYHRPAIHLFTYVEAFARLAWRSEYTSDIARLAELANEALEFLRIQNNVDHVVEVVEVTPLLAARQQPSAVSLPSAEQPPVESLPAAPAPEPAAPQTDLLPPEPPAPPKKRLQPRHL